MFTGLIEQIGTVKHIQVRNDFKILTVESGYKTSDFQLGESIACDGACLTVVSFDKKSFTVEASSETIARTILGMYKAGSKLNLERAMKLGDRMGGHLVSGHIDTVGKIEYLKPAGDSIEIAVSFSNEFDSLVIDKGSIAINGVSLTINKTKEGWLSVNIIPHTGAATTLTVFKQGDAVNLEFDMIGKYVQKMISKKEKNTLTIDKLIESGW